MAAPDEKLPVSKPALSYGACEDVPVMEEWSQPQTLLLLIWGALVQILAPMALVISYNNPGLLTDAAQAEGLDKGFFLDCGSQSGWAKSACDWTAPSVRIFPVLGLSLPVLLALWKLLHMRAYYILMRHRMMVSFREGKRLGFKCGVALAVVFLHALAHFALKVAFGAPCDDPSCAGKHILNTSWQDLLHDPSALEKDRTFVLAATKLAVLYVAPGTLSLVFLFSMDDFVAELVPMGLYFATKPGARYRELETYLHVKEDTMGAAVRQLLERAPPQGRFEEAAVHLREILKEHRCRPLGDGGSESEEAAEEAETPEAGSFLRGLRELLLLEWWPIQLLLDLPLVDDHSFSFNAFMVVHLLLTNVLIGFSVFVMFRRVSIMVGEDLAQNAGSFAFTFSTLYPLSWYFLLGSVSSVPLLRTLRLLAQVCGRVAQGRPRAPSPGHPELAEA